MTTNVAKLQALAAERIGAVTQRMTAGALPPAEWAREMERTIARAHTSAAIGGIADRTTTRPGSGLITPRTLSRTERAGIDRAVAAQRPYLRGFVDALRGGTLSDAQIQTRADRYAGPVRATYSNARWADVHLPAHPADGSTACLAWCRCAWAQRDDGYYWELGTGEHCPDCASRASQWAPWRAA